MKKKLAWVAALSAAALTLAACSGPTSTGTGTGTGTGDAGSNGEPIKVGLIADLSGPTADVGTPYNNGMLGYIEWRNQSGGIEGHMIEVDSNDYAYEVPKAEQLYKKYVANGAVVIQGWGTGDTEALISKVASDELPFMSGSLAEHLVDPAQAPFNFVNMATYSDQLRIALKWINEDSNGTGEVAVFHNDSPFGTAPLEDGENYIKDKGYKLGYKTYPMPKTANFVGLLSQAQAQGAKYIVIQNVSSPAAQVAKDIKAQGLDIKIVCLNWCADELFIQTAGADAADGTIMVAPVAPPVANKPGNADPAKFLESKGGDLQKEGLHYLQGWYTMHVMAKGIEAAIKSGEELTGASIRAALETMDAVDTGGVMGSPKFSVESHRGSTSAGVYEVKDGQMSLLQDNVTP